MEDVVYLVLALASLLVVLLARRWRRSSPDSEDKLRLPLGPWTLPVIGSMHHIAGALPHQAMRDLARRHGWPVMLLRLGEVPTLVGSSREGAREVMKTHDAAFATRPLSSTVRVLTNGGRDIIFAPYGEHWRQMRKIAVTELLTARRVLSFRAIREEEVGAMLRAVASAAGEGEAIDTRARRRVLGIDGIIAEHQQRMGTVDGDDEDLIDVLLRVQNDGSLQLPLDMDSIKAVIFDIFGAGSETSATTLEWIMAELVKNPKVMKRATAEVRRAFEAGGKVTTWLTCMDAPGVRHYKDAASCKG
uniref:Cytochrome P450 71D6 n=1 Tax=Aegilops tauschii TaxID=37682 RepID=M8CVT9_AEGTA